MTEHCCQLDVTEAGIWSVFDSHTVLREERTQLHHHLRQKAIALPVALR
jgi:hypothetical protein